jgi:hypothetical protein
MMDGYIVANQGTSNDRPEPIANAMQVAIWKRDADKYAQVKAVFKQLEGAALMSETFAAWKELYDLLHEKRNA